jgi:hypothetical protein
MKEYKKNWSELFKNFFDYTFYIAAFVVAWVIVIIYLGFFVLIGKIIYDVIPYLK